MEPQEGQITPVSRRTFLKLSGVALADLFFGQLLAACDTRTSSLSERAVTPKDVEAAFAREFPEPRHMPFENPQRQAEMDANITQNREIKQRVSGQDSRLIEFRNRKYQTNYRFFVPSGYAMPNENQLDAALDFLNAHNSYEKAPANEVTVFVADLGPDMISFTTMNMLSPGKARTFVNINPDMMEVQFGDPLTTEFCQAFFINAPKLDQRRIFGSPQEVICNRFGIAARFVRAGKPYDVYEAEAPTRGFIMEPTGIFDQVPKERDIERYDKPTYDEVINIFK